MSSTSLRAIRSLPGRPFPWPESRPGLGELSREALDRALALGLLVLAAPVLAAVALLVRLTSSGPILFRQERIGLHGRPFRMLKFRSMVPGAEASEEALAAASTEGPFFKVKGDARVTPVGRLLRRSSLDELPQLLNVVSGQMRLVGPRPLLVREHAALPASVRCWRDRAKPGLTGLWQVSGRSRTTPSTRLRLDRLQVERASLALDARILARTPRAVLRADGAF